MTSFAERTGVVHERSQRRYLWTDAFAVCNFLGLEQLDHALALVDRVHHELGRYRTDDTRRGWISGLSEALGEAHPTRGGLRIGKPLPERAANETVDERLEWERDGQYFHYLTKWMHALDRVAHATGDDRYTAWARELADTAYRHFVHAHGRRMYWKMSIDLTRPLVTSMGQHDPLDGYVTCLQLGLEEPLAVYRAMIDTSAIATADPLGIGGLLVDAHHLQQLERDRPLREALLAAAHVGLEHYSRHPDLRAPHERRLAFRELGLAIGLAAVEQMGAAFAEFQSVRASIVETWLVPEHRKTRSYLAHADINDVMLATSLAPAGFLGRAQQ